MEGVSEWRVSAWTKNGQKTERAATNESLHQP